jgi:hypothetical protein
MQCKAKCPPKNMESQSRGSNQDCSCTKARKLSHLMETYNGPSLAVETNNQDPPNANTELTLSLHLSDGINLMEMTEWHHEGFFHPSLLGDPPHTREIWLRTVHLASGLLESAPAFRSTPPQLCHTSDREFRAFYVSRCNAEYCGHPQSEQKCISLLSSIHLQGGDFDGRNTTSSRHVPTRPLSKVGCRTCSHNCGDAQGKCGGGPLAPRTYVFHGCHHRHTLPPYRTQKTLLGGHARRHASSTFPTDRNYTSIGHASRMSMSHYIYVRAHLPRTGLLLRCACGLSFLA